jgi:hypothetical protein
MAKVQSESIVIKLSRLVRDSDKEAPSAVTQELLLALEQVVQELVSDNIVVEAEVS